MTEGKKDVTFIVTRGNSSRFLGGPSGICTLDLEHRAVSRRIEVHVAMKYESAILTACWIVLLIAVGRLE